MMVGVLVAGAIQNMGTTYHVNRSNIASGRESRECGNMDSRPADDNGPERPMASLGCVQAPFADELPIIQNAPGISGRFGQSRRLCYAIQERMTPGKNE